jgi:hypothetical protein
MYAGELRCREGKLFGVVVEGVLEVRCQSKFCPPHPGVVVIHRFDLETGERLEDKRYKTPPKRTKGTTNGNP